MTLAPEEIERYARHIVLREIGGPGQQRLRAARILVVGAGGGEVEQRRAAEAARPDDEDARGAEPLLSCAADLVKHDMAGVALDLLRRERHAPVPVDPKPPVPRALSARALRSSQTIRTTGARTSWAIRIPCATVKGASPRLARMTPTSPR